MRRDIFPILTVIVEGLMIPVNEYPIKWQGWFLGLKKFKNKIDGVFAGIDQDQVGVYRYL